LPHRFLRSRSGASAPIAIPLGLALVAAIVLPAILLNAQDSDLLSFHAPAASKSREVDVAATERSRTVLKPPVHRPPVTVNRAAPAAPAAGTRAAEVHPSRAKTAHKRAVRKHVRRHGHAKVLARANGHAARTHKPKAHRAHNPRTHATHQPRAHTPKTHAPKKAKQHGKAKP
jgi:hypothetical protein